MSISDISIRNHVFAWMLMFGLLIFGWIAFQKMGVSQMPDVDYPNVSISISLNGASPEIMDLDVVSVVEEALTSVAGIQAISSSSKTGSASISVEFTLDKNIDVAVQEIQSALARAMRRLPSEIDPPVVRKTNSDSQPIIWLAVMADNMPRVQLMRMARDFIQDRFSTIEGVGEVTLAGYMEPNLRVWLKQERLDHFQLTATDILNTIQREHSEKPGGRIETPDIEMNIRTLGEAPNISDFENITISRRGGSLNYAPVALKEVALIEDGTEDMRSLSRSQGKNSIGIGIRKQPGANAVAVAKDVKKRLEQVKLELPPGVHMDVRFDSTKFIEEAVHELNFTLIFSAILTALVCWLFLGSISATFNVVLAIPTSIIGSFIILQALGFTLNTFTLLGLSLAIGIVVDDAIMVLENIVRHKEQGKDKVTASLIGAREITLAALAATVAIIAIFVPVTFMEGIIGKYFLQFGITLSVAVAISLLEALTLTPMRCSRFLSVEPRGSKLGKWVERSFEKSTKYYEKIIPAVIARPWFTIFFATIFFVASLSIQFLLKKEFVPSQDEGRLIVRAQTPVGSSLEFTDRKMKEIEAYFSSRSEVEGYFCSVGGGGDGGQVNAGFIFLNLKPAKERKLNAQALAQEFRRDLKKVVGIRTIIQDPSQSALGGRRSFPVQFTIRGPDWDKLAEYAKKIMTAMENSKMMTDVDDNSDDGMPEIQIIPDRVNARKYGVDVAEISQTVNIMMAGAIAGKYTQGGRRYDVRVGLPKSARNSQDVIPQLRVRNNQNELVPLEKLVKIQRKAGFQAISREDRLLAINVRANVAAHSSQSEAIAEVKRIAKEILPSGYTAVVSGSAKTFQDSFNGLGVALLLGILISYMVLASQFNSFIHPITILIALPFSLSGAFLSLYLGGQTLNIYSMIGIILLMGIVKKNSILLVEFTNQMKEKGMNTREALLAACPARLRPILMTSIATIVGAIPPALAIGPGAESRVPMALAVIGGVFVSTLLTLFVVPSVYSLFDRFHEHESRKN